LSYNINTDIGASLFLNGNFELKEIEFFSKKLSQIKTPTIIDVGSNIGLHSISWARDIHDAKIISIEPSPITSELLKKNINANKLSKKITVVTKAISNKQGNLDFYHCEDDAYSSLKDTKRKKVKKIFKIEVDTLDNIVDQLKLSKVDFIKIDVEGFDSEVIEGGVKTINFYKPDIFIEIYKGSNSNSEPYKTINMLLKIGYYAYVFSKGKVIKYEGVHSDSLYNYYFTMKQLK
jgi:FkbM family methyltransferase